MTGPQKRNAAVAGSWLLVCLAASCILPYIAYLAGAALGQFFGFFLFYSTQYIFPFEHVRFLHDDGSLAVFSGQSALLLSCVQWLVVAVVFGWCFRNDARLRRVVPLAVLTVAVVTITVCLVIAACGASIEIDSL